MDQNAKFKYSVTERLIAGFFLLFFFFEKPKHAEAVLAYQASACVGNPLPLDKGVHKHMAVLTMWRAVVFYLIINFHSTFYHDRTSTTPTSPATLACAWRAPCHPQWCGLDVGWQRGHTLASVVKHTDAIAVLITVSPIASEQQCSLHIIYEAWFNMQYFIWNERNTWVE